MDKIDDAEAQDPTTETNDSTGSTSDRNKDAESLQGVLQKLAEASEETGEQTSVGEIIDAFGNRAYGPLLLIPAFLALIPITGGIPGMSMITATIIIVVAVQMLFHHGTLWLPSFIRKRSVSHEKLERLVRKTSKWAKWFDWLFRPRFEFLTNRPFSYFIAIFCIGLAATMYPLAFVPLGAAPPSFVIMLLALALTAKDGVLAAVGIVLSGVSAWLAYYLMTNFWSSIQEGLSWLGLA